MPARIRPTLLLTRPRADSLRFARLLPGWQAVIAPILRIVPVDHDAARLRAAGALLFTSAHAVAAAGPGAGRAALCVGGRTAEAARKAGFDVTEGPGDAAGLLPLIARWRGAPLLHPHGRHLARELPVPGMVVYEQKSCDLTDEARDLLARGGDVVLPLFSARSAALAAAAVRGSMSRLWPVAISATVMQAWDGPRAGTAIAQQPTQEGMVQAIRCLGIAEL